MDRMAAALQLVQFVWLPLLVLTTAAQQPRRATTPAAVSRPGCPDTCGNITVPYPFGIGAGCYHGDPDGVFHLDCNDTAAGSSPQPRLTDHANGDEVLDISLSPPQARFYSRATRACFDEAGRDAGHRAGPSGFGNTRRYLYSAARNKLFVLGCNYLGYVFDTGTIYMGSCMSVCLPTPAGGVNTFCEGLQQFNK